MIDKRSHSINTKEKRMNKTARRLATLVCACALAFGGAVSAQAADTTAPQPPKFAKHWKTTYVKVKPIFDHVYDAGTYTNLDEKAARAFFDTRYDLYRPAGCTAFAKTTRTEGTIVGRNLDFYASNYPQYFFRTKRKGMYKTIGLAYLNKDLPTNDEVKRFGVNSDYHKLLPIMAPDVMNEHGFYIEMNMRTDEYDKDGKSIFACSGTRSAKGLQSELRLSAMLLPFFLAERCKNVDEALDYVKNRLDLYTPAPGTAMPWNLCYIMADASGKYGLLEIAQNEVRFTQGGMPKQCDSGTLEMRDGSAQANFYIDPGFAAQQRMKIGLGRYASVRKGWAGVETEADAFALMSSITYFQSYFPWSAFDNKTENVTTVITDKAMLRKLGMKEKYLNKVWDTEFVNEHPEYVDAYVRYNMPTIMKHLADGTLRDANSYWESAYTLVANCNKKTLLVRFTEENKKMIRFSFDY